MRRTAAEAAETRHRVVAEALLAFAERGWEGATFDHIAGRARVTRGAVHHHFPGGKDELLHAVLAEQWDRYGERVLAPLRGEHGTAERLQRFLTQYVRLLASDAVFRALATVTTLVAPHASAVSDGVTEHRRALSDWAAAIRQAIDPAVLRPGVIVETAVLLLVNFVVGAIDTAALAPEWLPGESAATALVGGLVER